MKTTKYNCEPNKYMNDLSAMKLGGGMYVKN